MASAIEYISREIAWEVESKRWNCRWGMFFIFFLYKGKGKRFSNAHTSSISNEPKHHWGASERLKRWAEHYCTIYSIRSWSCTNLNTGVMTKWSQILDKRTSSVWPAYEFALADAHGSLPLKKVLGSLNLLFSLHFIQHLHPLYLHAHSDMYIYTHVLAAGENNIQRELGKLIMFSHG